MLFRSRFKNGILVDDFTGFSVADTFNVDYLASINRRLKRLSAAQYVSNFALKNNDEILSNGNLSPTTKSSLNYQINKDGIVTHYSLPYTTTSLASQIIASRTINVNPFNMPLVEGVLEMLPNVDVWVDNTRDPSLLITNPNLKIYSTSSTFNTLQLGDWQTV